MFTTVKFRPVVIAERHNASAMTYAYYTYLKNTPLEVFDFCLFEGALETQTHLDNIKNACHLYTKLVCAFLATPNSTRIKTFMDNDLSVGDKQFSDFATKHSDFVSHKKNYPHGFGQVQNLTAHYLLSLHLNKHHTQWIAIDDKRTVIKKMAEQSITDNRAYLYKRHKNIGHITTLKQQILLEAAPIRSKYMGDKIIDYACRGRCLVLMGDRHALDISVYTPDLTDIFGYNPQDNNDDLFYHYNMSCPPTKFDIIPKHTQFNRYYRPVTLENTKKIKSDFNLGNFYLDKLKKLQNTISNF